MTPGKNQPSGSTTSTTSQQPFAPQYFASSDPGALYNRAMNVGGQNLQYFPGQTYADPTQQQNQAISAQSNLAQNDQTMQGATQGIQPYLSGQMMNAGNPAFQNMVGQLGQAIAPSVDSHFASNGRYGSGANANAFASALTNQAGQMAYQNYNDQSTNQLKAMLLAPQISGGNFNDISQLNAAGAQQQQQNQLPITQAMNAFQFNQDAPYLQAQRMQSLLTGGSGGGASTQPYFTNPIGSAVGTGIGALGLYNGVNSATGGGASNSISSLWNSLFGGGMGSSLNANSLSTLGSTSPGDI